MPCARSNAMAAVRRASTPATLVRYSIVPRLSLIGLQIALRRSVELGQRCVVQLVADQRGRGVLHQQRGRRHGAERRPCAAVQTPLRVQGDADAAADHGDVHFGARDQAQIGVAGTRRGCGRWISRTNSSFASEVRPGPTGIMLRPGPRACPCAPTITAVAPAAIMAGTLSAAGEALQRLPASVARPWIWVEPIRSMASTTPGQACFRRRMRLDHRAGRGRADDEAAVFLADAHDAGDFLGIDDQIGLGPARPKLDQKIGSAGQQFGLAGGSGKQCDGFIDRRR